MEIIGRYFKAKVSFSLTSQDIIGVFTYREKWGNSYYYHWRIVSIPDKSDFYSKHSRILGDAFNWNYKAIKKRLKNDELKFLTKEEVLVEIL